MKQESIPPGNAPDRFLHRFEAGDDPVESEFTSLPRLGVGSLFLPQEFDILLEFVQSPARCAVRAGGRGVQSRLLRQEGERAREREREREEK
jgi:hypothetical protein